MSQKKSNLKLTNENYYSLEANQQYMSVSQYKSFRKCEAAAMAELRGEWKQTTTPALLIGSYVDAWFEGTLDEFRTDHPEMFKKDGSLYATYEIAEKVIARVQQDKTFMRYMAGKKQTIKTAELFGTTWKIKIDSYHRDKIVDLKVMRSMERIMGKSFVEHWGYDLQMAIYAAIEAICSKRGSDYLATYLAVATKQDPVDIEIISIPRWHRVELLEEVEREMPHILAVKRGEVAPVRCGVCEYCRATKEILEPIDFELVGLSAAERMALLGSL